MFGTINDREPEVTQKRREHFGLGECLHIFRSKGRQNGSMKSSVILLACDISIVRPEMIFTLQQTPITLSKS